jgi:hypothetical protein
MPVVTLQIGQPWTQHSERLKFAYNKHTFKAFLSSVSNRRLPHLCLMDPDAKTYNSAFHQISLLKKETVLIC